MSSSRQQKEEVAVKASRKRRIALPGGRFNKASEVPVAATPPVPSSDDTNQDSKV